MKITGILSNTPLYTTEPIIVPSVQTETWYRVLSLPMGILYFLKFPSKKKLKEIANKVKKIIIHYYYI